MFRTLDCLCPFNMQFIKKSRHPISVFTHKLCCMYIIFKCCQIHIVSFSGFLSYSISIIFVDHIYELLILQDDKNIAHLTHVSEMEKKCESLARITAILKDVIQNKVLQVRKHYFLSFFLRLLCEDNSSCATGC
jgi:hypothetical protein